MSGDRQADAAARRAIRELADPAPRLFADLAASDRLTALEPELPLLEVDPFGSLSLAPEPPRSRAQKTGSARTAAGTPAGGTPTARRARDHPPPAEVAGARARAGWLVPHQGESETSTPDAERPGGPAGRLVPDIPVPVTHDAPVLPLGRIPVAAASGDGGGGQDAATGGGRLRIPGDSGSSGDHSTTVSEVSAPSSPPEARELADQAAGADAEPAFELLDRLASSILERARREERDAAAGRARPSRRLPAPLEELGLDADRPPPPGVGSPGLAALGEYPAAATAPAAGEATGDVPPRPADAASPHGPPVQHVPAEQGLRTAFGIPASGAPFEADDLASAVNDALVEQARRHGVDLA